MTLSDIQQKYVCMLYLPHQSCSSANSVYIVYTRVTPVRFVHLGLVELHQQWGACLHQAVCMSGRTSCMVVQCGQLKIQLVVYQMNRILAA